MRICHVIVSLDPASGGPFAVVTGLAAAQAALGHDVWIVTSCCLDRSGHRDSWLRDAHGLDKVNIVSNLDLNQGAAVARLRPHSQMRRIISGSDIVHLHGVWDPILWMAAAVARRVGTIYAVTPHGMLDPWSLSQKRWKKKLALLLGFKKMLRHAAFLHLLNEDEQARIEPLSIACETAIIPNGVSYDDIAELPRRGSFYLSHPELNARPFILFLGRLHYKKGLNHLINAFSLVSRKHNQVDLVIAGPDHGDQHNIERQARELGIIGRVHFTGPIYGKDKFSALVDATVFCLPSMQEGFSMSIVEALACKLPVVISSHCHFSEVAEVGAGEIVDLEPRAICDAISRLIGNEDFRHRAGEAGRALVCSRFTWPKIAQDTITAYARALDKNHCAALEPS